MKCVAVACLLSFLLLPGITCAQSDEHKWALQYNGGVFVQPFFTGNSSDVPPGRGESTLLTGELYLAGKWNLQGGYFRTDLSYGDGKRTMEGLQLGIKKYFLPREYIFQPYLSGASQINWSRHTERMEYFNDTYLRQQQTVNPRISFVPGVGFDFYLFSSIALVMEYNINMGINSRTEVTYAEHGQSVFFQDKGIFQSLTLGVKLTFPFTVTSSDGTSLFMILFDALMGSVNRYNEYGY